MKRKRLIPPLLLLTAALSACAPEEPTDTTNPTVTLASVASPVTTSSVTVSAKASDDMGIARVEFYLDDATTPFASDTSADASQNYTAGLNVTAAQNGIHTIRVVAVDTSGNRSAAATQQITVNIDNVPPVVTLAGLPTTITSATTFSVTYSATDNVGVTSVRGVLTRQGSATTLFDQTATIASGTLGPVTVDASLNGTYTLTVTATDAAGNVGQATRTVVVDIPATPAPAPVPTPTPTPDTEAPRVSITVPQSPITVAGNYDIVISLSDNVRVTSVTGYVLSDALGRIELTNLDPVGGKATIPVSKAFNGNNTIYVTARDAAGNEGKAQASVQVNIP